MLQIQSEMDSASLLTPLWTPWPTYFFNFMKDWSVFTWVFVFNKDHFEFNGDNFHHCVSDYYWGIQFIMINKGSILSHNNMHRLYYDIWIWLCISIGQCCCNMIYQTHHTFPYWLEILKDWSINSYKLSSKI